MDAQKIEIKRGKGDKRRNALLLDEVIRQREQLGHRFRSSASGYGLESDTGSTVGGCLENVDVFLLVLARISYVSTRKAMQFEHRFFRDREPIRGLVNDPESVPITADFFLISIAERRPAKNDCADTG